MHIGSLPLGVPGALWSPANNIYASLCSVFGLGFRRWGSPRVHVICPCDLQPRRHMALAAKRGVKAQEEISQSLGGKMTKEAQEYWRGFLAQVEKPSAKELIQYLDLSHPLGLTQRQNKSTPLVDFYLETKEQHAEKVLLVRVGEFYETYGIDAVIMVQWAGLNPMGRASTDNPPRAGLPKGNLRRTLRDLIDAQLSVELTVRDIRMGLQAPPTTKNRSCVYVLRCRDGYFYIGQTDDLQTRLKDHKGKFKNRGGFDAAYLIVPLDLEGMSMARAIEAHAIREFGNENFPLISTSDGRNKNMPRRAPSVSDS